MSTSFRPPISWLLLCLFIGAASGITGVSIAVYSFSKYAQTLEELSLPLRLGDERPAPVTVSKTIDALMSSVSGSVVPLFVSDRAMDRADSAVASGVALTSDGWVLTSGSVEVSRGRAFIKNTSYAVDRVVRDPATGSAFIHIAADGLPVATFGSGTSLSPGSDVYLVPVSDHLVRRTLVAVDPGEAYDHSWDVSQKRLVLDAAANVPPGTPVFDAAGKLVGIMADAVRAVPIDTILPALSSLLKDGSIHRIVLGVSGTDLSRAAPASGSSARAGLKVSAVRPGSVAAIAGVRAGDIILEVDGEAVGRRTLDELILGFAPGARVPVSVERPDGSVADLEMILTDK